MIDLLSISLVKQSHPKGCGSAVLAMLTGKPYEFFADEFKRLGRNPETDGVHYHQLDQILVDDGYAMARRCRYYSAFGGDRQERKPWPPVPFADAHLCEVKVLPTSPGTHFTVMLRDGRVLDPLQDDPRRLSDYFEVWSVTGLYHAT